MRFAFYDRLPPARRRIYDRSDGIVELPIPPGADLAPDVAAIIDALAAADLKAVRRGCQKLLDALTDRFGVPPLKARVYAVRPSGDWGELHGMYRPREDGGPPDVELWMRTARFAKVVAPRTFLRTLLHELCQHLGSLCIACADRVAAGIDRWQGARCSRYRDIDKPSNAASGRFRRNPPGRGLPGG